MPETLLKTRYFEEALSKNLEKVNIFFLSKPDTFFMNEIMKNKRSLKLVTSLTLVCKMCSEKSIIFK